MQGRTLSRALLEKNTKDREAQGPTITHKDVAQFAHAGATGTGRQPGRLIDRVHKFGAALFSGVACVMTHKLCKASGALRDLESILHWQLLAEPVELQAPE